ncbi:MAG TPA: TolC family protein, partial [Phycisphaerales bacterium]|nr:TolC family protein [Phycisphaerales bacterium]
MSQKVHQLFTVVSIFLLQTCDSPLVDLGKLDGKTGVQASETALRAIHFSGNKDAPHTFPQTRASEVEESLKERSDELEKLSPANSSVGWESDVGTDLYLDHATAEQITKSDAVRHAIENNLDLEIASIEPAVTKQSIESAKAAFDFVLGASISSNRSRIPQQQFNLEGGGALNAAESTIDTFAVEASLIKKLHGCGTITLSTNLTRSNNDASGFNYTPNPAWQSIGAVGLSQPLLRDFGETTTLAQIRLSEILHGQALEEMKESLNRVITETEHAYLNLALQWKVLQVKQWLLAQGESVVEILEIRMEYDTSEADYAQAVATVEQRRADVIGQQAAVR